MSTYFNALEVGTLVRGSGFNSRTGVRLVTVADSNWTSNVTITVASEVLTISGLNAGTSLGLIDTFEPVADDRILIKDAGVASAGAAANNGYNGIWQVTGGTTTSLTLVRAADLEVGDETQNVNVWATQSNTYGKSSWVCTSSTTIATNGSNPNLWARHDVAGTLEVGRGGTGLTTFGGTNTLLYTSTANNLASLATANNSVLSTNGSGVPSLSSTLPTGLSTLGIENLSLNDATTSAFNLSLISDSNTTALTANRSFFIDVNNADRVLDISGDLTLGGNFTTTPANAVTFTTTGTTTLTLPQSGTLASTSYVDAVAQGLDVKGSCRLATNANSNWTTSASLAYSAPTLTITGLTAGTTLGLIDAIEPAASNRILIKDAGVASAGAAASDIYNGIWSVTGGTTTSLTLVRATDADTDVKVTAGMFTFVEEGTVADSGFVLTTNDPITLGTSLLVFAQFSSAGVITAGNGITKTGNEISVNLKPNGGLAFESGQVAVNLGASSITGTLAVGDGGTGLTSVATNGLLYGAGTSPLGVVASANNSTLVTDGSGVPSLSTTLPTTVQGNITQTGTITTGTWNASTIGVAYGGTGKTSVTANALVYGAGTSALVEISPAASSVLVTNGSNVPSWNTTLPSSLTIPSPVVSTGIFDVNSNEMVTFTPTASAVNNYNFTNSATGTGPTLSAVGGDTNISMNFASKGTGTYNLQSDSASAAELRIYDDTADYVGHKPVVGITAVTYEWPSAPSSSGQLLSGTTGGVLSWNTPSSLAVKRDFTILNFTATTTGTTAAVIAVFPWNDTDLSVYTTRTVTFWHVTGTNPLVVDIFDGTSALGSATTTASTSGIATFTFTAPGANRSLSLRIRQTVNGTPRPQIDGAYLTLT